MASKRPKEEPKEESWKPDYTTGDILSLYETRSKEKDEVRIRDLVDKIRKYCRMDHKVEIPAQYQAITREAKTPYFRDAHLRIASSLISKYPVVHCTPGDENVESYRQAANIAERADRAMIERFNKELGIDIIFNLASALTRDGASVLKIVHRPSAWANFPLGVTKSEQDSYKKSAPFPIMWRPIDRLSMVFEDGEYGDAWAIEYGEYTKPYLKSRYQMEDSNGKLVDPARSLEGMPMPEGLQTSSTGRSIKVEFFNDREWHVIIDGSAAPGWPKANPYAPHIPYFKAQTYESESLLYSLLFLVPRLDELLTMKMNWAYLGAYPNPVLQSVPNAATPFSLDSPTGDSDDTGSTPFVWTPGKAIEVPLGKTFGFVPPPPIGKDINELSMIFRDLIQIAGIPSIMRGGGLSGDTGYLANQQASMAFMAYKIAAISGQRQLEKGLEFSHFLVSNVIKQTVYVKGWDSVDKTGAPNRKSKEIYLGLSDEEESPNIANLYKVGGVEVKYRPVLPTDDQAMAMIAVQTTNASKPLYGRRKALERFMQEEDPDGILEELRVEEALDREPLAGIILTAALREAKILPGTNPAEALVGPSGAPLIPPGPGQTSPVTPMEQTALGTPSVRGLNQPIVGGGGRPAGMYPGQPPQR